jgi:hypothetical protein
MDNMIKGEWNNESVNSSSTAPANFQDSSDITGEGDLPDYYDDF